MPLSKIGESSTCVSYFFFFFFPNNFLDTFVKRCNKRWKLEILATRLQCSYGPQMLFLASALDGPHNVFCRFFFSFLSFSNFVTFESGVALNGEDREKDHIECPTRKT